MYTYDEFWNIVGGIHASILDADHKNPTAPRNDNAQIGIDMSDAPDEIKALYRKIGWKFGSFRMPNIAELWQSYSTQ